MYPVDKESKKQYQSATQMRKHTKFYIAQLLLFVFVSGCSAIKAINLVNSSEVVMTDDIDSRIPFITEGNQILVELKINHSREEYTFILDTGALTMVSERVSEKLSLPEGIEIDASGTGGNTRAINLVKLNSVVVGGMEVKNCAAGVIDFSSIFPHTIDGILGSNFLRHFKVTIDFQKQELTLSQDTTPVHAQDNDVKIPIELDMLMGFAPVVQCELDDAIQDDAIIDTGLSGYIGLPVSMIKKLPSFTNGSVVTSNGSMGFGMFGSGKNENYALRLNHAEIGSLQLQNVAATSHAHQNGKILIGHKFLEKYIVILNYPAKELLLRPTGVPFEHNIPSYGFALTKNDQKTLVSGVWMGSDAFQKGLQPGDEILAINSVPMSTVPTIGEVVQMFFADEEQHSLSVEFSHENERKSLVLHKKNLLPDL
jgi:predicted aspartyl protease